MSEHYEDLIREIANMVREQIDGGTIYGVPVDMNNLDHVIAAAYLYGCSSELARRCKAQNSINMVCESS